MRDIRNQAFFESINLLRRANQLTNQAQQNKKVSPACLPGTIESDHVLIFVIIGIVWDYLCLHQPDSFNDPVAEITSLQLALLNGRPVMNAAIQP